VPEVDRGSCGAPVVVEQSAESRRVAVGAPHRLFGWLDQAVSHALVVAFTTMLCRMISDNYFCRPCCLTSRCYHVASPDLLPGSRLRTAIDDAIARRSNALVHALTGLSVSGA